MLGPYLGCFIVWLSPHHVCLHVSESHHLHVCHVYVFATVPARAPFRSPAPASVHVVCVCVMFVCMYVGGCALLFAATNSCVCVCVPHGPFLDPS